MSSDEMSAEKAFGEPGSFQPGGDVEGGRRDSTIVQGRKMSRIGPPPRGSVSADEHAKLVEMEADNAIQYRTCSWQMVRTIPMHT